MTSQREPFGGVAASWALVLGAAFVLRAIAVWTGSLHLDDFHSLHHASAPDWRSFFTVLAQDNHPPLSFVVLRGVRAVLGEGELALRLPALVFGLLHVAWTWRLAGHLGGRRIRAGAALLVAFSALALEQSRDVRMYALLALAVTGMLDAVLDVLEGRRAALRLALFTWIGLHTHYHFVHALAVTAIALLLLLARRRDTRRNALPLLQGFGAALLASLPWYLTGFASQLGHELAPGGSATSPGLLASSFAHLAVHDLRLAGPLLSRALMACGAVAIVLAGCAWLATARDRTLRRAVVVLGAGAFLLPAWSALVAWLVPRAGFEWRYLVGATAPFAAWFAVGAFRSGPAPRLRHAAGVGTLAGCLVLSLVNALDPGRENYEDGVRYVLERATPEDAVVAADWQPRLFPHSVGWRYYSRHRGDPERLPVLLDHTDDFGLAPDTDLSGYRRVFVVLRSVPDGVGLLRTLRAHYAEEEKAVFGTAIWVHAFRAPRDAGPTDG